MCESYEQQFQRCVKPPTRVRLLLWAKAKTFNCKKDSYLRHRLQKGVKGS